MNPQVCFFIVFSLNPQVSFVCILTESTGIFCLCAHWIHRCFLFVFSLNPLNPQVFFWLCSHWIHRWFLFVFSLNPQVFLVLTESKGIFCLCFQWIHEVVCSGKQVLVDIMAQFHAGIGMWVRGPCMRSVWRWATSAVTGRRLLCSRGFAMVTTRAAAFWVC